MTTVCKQLFLCLLLLTCVTSLRAQPDSVRVFFERDTVVVYDHVAPTPKVANEPEPTWYGAGWYVVSQVARYFNVGVYYSYIMPTGTLRKEVSSKSAFSFDIGLDLTQMFGRNESYWHWMIGMNADYVNFGKTKSPHSRVSGDTTYSFSISNSASVYSYYIEAEYGKSFLAPFASVAYADTYFTPYKKSTTTIHNANTNSTNSLGEEMGSFHSRGINISAGLKYKYRFNEHKQLMLITRVSYLKSAAIDMIDLSTVVFSSYGSISYQTKSVSPSWLMLSVGAKYNF